MVISLFYVSKKGLKLIALFRPGGHTAFRWCILRISQCSICLFQWPPSVTIGYMFQSYKKHYLAFVYSLSSEEKKHRNSDEITLLQKQMQICTQNVFYNCALKVT